MDGYLAYYQKSVELLENVYGLSQEQDGKKLSELSVRELVPLINKGLASISPRALEDKNSEAWAHVGLIYRLYGRSKFYNKRRLKFKGFPSKEQLVKSLTVFKNRSTLNIKTREEANGIAGVLHIVDVKHLRLRLDDNLEYRILRCILIMILHSNYSEAALLVDWVLWEMGGEV